MQEAYLNINGVRTNVSTWGRWVEEEIKNETAPDIVIIIPGNPGINGFYEQFAKIIHEKLQYPVWCVGHAGHSIPKNSATKLPPLKQNEDIYGLQGQVKHKIDFIDKYVPKNARIHFIGHSIGCYIILELLKHEQINKHVVDVQLLFPTIEHMVETSNGVFLTKTIKPMLWLILFASWFFTILPFIVKRFLIYAYMFIMGIPREQHFRNIYGLVDPQVLEKVFFMAYEEMDQVKERNNDVVRENVDKIKLFYGKLDGWAPESYYNKIKSDIPNVKAELSNFNHTFVLHQSVEIANIVSEWLKND